MRIRDDHGLSGRISQQARPVQGSRAGAEGQVQQGGGPVEDSVELSDRARALQVAKTALAKLPDVRQEKVEELKRKVESGAYHVPGEKVAERMLAEGLFA